MGNVREGVYWYTASHSLRMSLLHVCAHLHNIGNVILLTQYPIKPCKDKRFNYSYYFKISLKCCCTSRIM